MKIHKKNQKSQINKEKWESDAMWLTLKNLGYVYDKGMYEYFTTP